MDRRTLLVALRSLAGNSAFAGDFADPIFATPSPHGPGAFIPSNSMLNAPVITPMGMKWGSNVFEVTPAGMNRDSSITKDPASRLVSYPPECTGWFTAEYLYWATQGITAPPLVTTGPAILGPGAAGFIGQPTTQYLLGGQPGLGGLRSGVRVSMGLFIDDAKDWAVSHEIISLGSRSERLVGGSDGTNVVNLPQIVSVGGVPVETPMYVGFPGLTRGTVTASEQTSFFSGDTHIRRVMQDPSGVRLDLLAGYRFLHLGDSVSDSFDIVAPGLSGARLMGEDSIRTRNYFHGGELGFNISGRSRSFTYALQTTLALGVTASEFDQSRTRSVFGAGLAIPAPIASHGQTDYFAVVPQVGFKLGWQPWQHVRFTAGYDFLYWSRVRRAQEMDLLSPTLGDGKTDFWAQGLSVGAEVRY